jgi:hypothetical protein
MEYYSALKMKSWPVVLPYNCNPAICKSEIGRIWFDASPGKKVRKTPFQQGAGV